LSNICLPRPVVLLVLLISCSVCGAQETQSPPPEQKQEAQEKVAESVKQEPTTKRIRDLPIVWLIGPYIPATGPLQPLTKEQRTEVYFRQTFLTAGTYVSRAFAAGIDQARAEPSRWGGGVGGYGQRFANRYGQYLISNTIQTFGDGALGYEPRYDLCRCSGFKLRTKHAILRNFVTYDNTERDRKLQIPMYAGAFAAGAMSRTWLPGNHNAWRDGGVSSLWQAGLGSSYNFVSEFSFDILHKLGIAKNSRRE
jgi:hypothetical protein